MAGTGEPFRVVVAVGPMQCNGRTKRATARMERRIQQEVDAAVRKFMAVGPYSKTVRTRRERV